jgi:photosystem II stability/assembly factor-like uncharacterized protein
MKTKILLLTWAGVSFIFASVCPAHAQHWTPLTSPSANWQSIASSADGIKLVAAVIEGPIYTSTNSGITWTLTSAPTNRWSGVASSADGTRLVAVAESPDPLSPTPRPQFGAIYTSTDSGATWT